MALHQQSDNDLIQLATPIMDNLIDGSTKKDWAKHTRDFTESARAGLSETELLRQCEAYQASHGHFANRELMGLIRHPDYISVYWKQRMTSVPGEYLAVLSLVEVNGEVRVIRCYVDLWEPRQPLG
jgi:hypothetical protein